MKKYLVLLLALGLISCVATPKHGTMKHRKGSGDNERAYVIYGNWFDKKHGSIPKVNRCNEAFKKAIQMCKAESWDRESYFGCILPELYEADGCLDKQKGVIYEKKDNSGA